MFSGNTFGLLIAPFVVGIVYDRADYYAVFGIISGVFGLDYLLRAFMIEKREAIKYLPEDQKSSTSPGPDSQHAGEAGRTSPFSRRFSPGGGGRVGLGDFGLTS